MKSYKFSIISTLVVLTFLVGCKTTRLDGYKATSTDEEEIIQTLIKSQNAWNNSEEKDFVAEFCNNGVFAHRTLASSRGEKRKVSKDEITNIFDDAHGNMGYFNLVNPKIIINGDKATVRGSNADVSIPVNIKILLGRENEKWCIEDWDYFTGL